MPKASSLVFSCAAVKPDLRMSIRMKLASGGKILKTVNFDKPVSRNAFSFLISSKVLVRCALSSNAATAAA